MGSSVFTPTNRAARRKARPARTRAALPAHPLSIAAMRLRREQDRLAAMHRHPSAQLPA